MQLNIFSNKLLLLPATVATPSFIVKGVVKTNSANTSGALVRLFERSNGALVGQAITKADGSYHFTVNDMKEKFLIAHHPKRTFNAVTQDNVVPK